ncbi:MAG: formyltetrahydrofolate deformylase [Candidatus Eisenbacteria bacterium]|uniref:Formyltetrahydrofolate deformylase n=1 Tax=Eiseniibacteriota bacterium TaxID=2212470 RepID=A0A956NFJ1_UNCEI|nr:formyltetrahydrofolate deformylase [Candidatus Eisenbacteria bacterium]
MTRPQDSRAQSPNTSSTSSETANRPAGRTSPTATILLSCPEQPGVVARLAGFLSGHGGNITHSDNHTDFAAKLFLTRIEWQLDGFDLARDEIPLAFAPIAAELGADWSLAYSDIVPRVALFVSKQEHCLLDLLWRHRAGELHAEIPLVVSNHDALRGEVEREGIQFVHLPVTRESKSEVEAQELALLREHRIDLVVLAKYMQVLSDDFIDRGPRVLNIHHSFLPAFVGAKPYHQAYDRGVKIIGATAHYVTPELDAGPIIEQDVARVSHRDGISDLIRKGKDLERVVLARAVRLHLMNRVLVYGNKTVVFG